MKCACVSVCECVSLCECVCAHTTRGILGAIGNLPAFVGVGASQGREDVCHS